MLNRQQMIEELTKYELSFLLDIIPDTVPSYFDEMVEFFAKGGFNTWTTEALQKKYDLFIKEEQDA